MVLFNIRKMVIVYAYIWGMFGIVLHMPYITTNDIQQLRKLAFVFAIVFCMIISISKDEPIERMERKDIDNNKHKTE